LLSNGPQQECNGPHAEKFSEYTKTKVFLRRNEANQKNTEIKDVKMTPKMTSPNGCITKNKLSCREIS